MTASRRRPSLAALGLGAPVAACVLLIYLIHPAIGGFRFPIGPDGPVYTWLARLAAEVGFVDAPGGGPGVPALTLVLGTLLRIEPVQTVMLLGPVLATVTGLAAGALLEVTLGADRLRTAVAVVMTGAFAAYLAGGWLANVAMAAIFLLAVAALSSSSSRSMWTGGALLLGAGLSHRIFIVIGAAILLGAAAWQFLESRRGRRDAGGTIAAVRLGGAAIGGPAAALLIGAWIGSGPRIPGDTSQDGFFRRNGLRELLLDRYRERLVDDATRAAVPITTGLGLSIPWTLTRPGRDDRGRFLHDVIASWTVLSVAAIAILAATGWGPPYRVIQFAFFLPIAAAAGLAILTRRSRLWALVGVVAGAAFIAGSMVGWFRQAPAFDIEDVMAAARAGETASSLPTGTPLVFVVDTHEPAAGYHVARAANIIRMSVPPARIPDVRVVVGRPDDVLARKSTTTGDFEHDRLSEVYLREAAPLLDRAAILIVRRFNPEGFEEANAGVLVAEGVISLTRGDEMRIGAVTTGPPGLSIPALFVLSLAALGLLGVLGLGWARWALGRGTARAVVLAAPSAGAAATIVAVVAADRLGLLPGSTGSIIAVVILGAVGYVLAARDQG